MKKPVISENKVQPLINNLDSGEAYRARVLDVRNWFEFWADERFRNTDELKKTYRQMGQLSGGEKSAIDLHYSLFSYRLSIRHYQGRKECQEPSLYCCR